MAFFRPQPRHAETRTRDDERARLAHFLGFATDAVIAGMTSETLVVRFKKLPAAEVMRALDGAKARRAARG